MVASGDDLWEAERECISTPPTYFFFPGFGFCFFFLLMNFLAQLIYWEILGRGSKVTIY